MEQLDADIDKEAAPVLHEALKAMLDLIGDSDKEAAPILYVALKSMVDLLGDDDLEDNGELSGASICDLARYAVAKAERRA